MRGEHGHHHAVEHDSLRDDEHHLGQPKQHETDAQCEAHGPGGPEDAVIAQRGAQEVRSRHQIQRQQCTNAQYAKRGAIV